MNRTDRFNYLKFRIENQLRKSDQPISELKSFLDSWRFSNVPESWFHQALHSLMNDNVIDRYRVGRAYYYTLKNKKRGLRQSTVSEIGNGTFGVEIELGSKIENGDMIAILDEAGLSTLHNDGRWMPADKRKYQYWQVVTDSSIDVPDFPFDIEIVSPILCSMGGLRQLHRIFDIINRMKWYGLVKQNKTCGTHVHHGAQGMPMGRFISLAEKAQPMMDNLVSKTRIVSDEKIEEDLDRDFHISPIKRQKYYIGGKIDWHGEKYVNISIRRFKLNGTVEFRQLQGTTRFRKVYEWIIMGQKLIEAAKLRKEIEDFKNLVAFFTFLGLARIAKRYSGR